MCPIAAAAQPAAAERSKAGRQFLIPTERVPAKVMRQWRETMLRAHRRPHLPVTPLRTHRLRIQLQAAVDLTAADMKTVVAAAMMAAGDINP